MHATSTFTFDDFTRSEPWLTEGAVAFARAHIAKRFTGDIVGTSTVEMMSATGSAGPAAYCALEHLQVSVQGRAGSFALLHRGIATPTGRVGTWEIVPGTGAGALAGITGAGRIDIVEGVHHFVLDYTLE